MTKKTQKELLVAGLEQRGYERVKPTTKYVVFRQHDGQRLFVGRAGALRRGHTVQGSIPVREDLRQKIMVEGRDGPAKLDPATSHVVFVYGTLKRGHHNWERLLTTSEYLCTAATERKLYVVHVGYPVAFTDGPEPRHVAGELFRVTPETLQRLDDLEGHPHHYQRTPVQVLCTNGLQIVTAEMYLNHAEPRLGHQRCQVNGVGEYEWAPDLR